MLRHRSQTTQITPGLLCFTAGLVKHLTICHLAKKKGGGRGGSFQKGCLEKEDLILKVSHAIILQIRPTTLRSVSLVRPRRAAR